jgi:hypothetical protein
MSVGALLSLLIYLLVLGLIIWLCIWVIDQIAPPDPIGRVVKVVITVIGVILLIVVLLNFVGVGPPLIIPAR